MAYGRQAQGADGHGVEHHDRSRRADQRGELARVEVVRPDGEEEGVALVLRVEDVQRPAGCADDGDVQAEGQGGDCQDGCAEAGGHCRAVKRRNGRS